MSHSLLLAESHGGDAEDLECQWGDGLLRYSELGSLWGPTVWSAAGLSSRKVSYPNLHFYLYLYKVLLKEMRGKIYLPPAPLDSIS